MKYEKEEKYQEPIIEIFPCIRVGDVFKEDFTANIKRNLTLEQKEYLRSKINDILDLQMLGAKLDYYLEFDEIPWSDDNLLHTLLSQIQIHQKELQLTDFQVIDVLLLLYPQVLYCMRDMFPSEFGVRFTPKPVEEDYGILEIWAVNPRYQKYGFKWWFGPYRHPKDTLDPHPKYIIGEGENTTEVGFMINIRPETKPTTTVIIYYTDDEEEEDDY